MTDFARRLARRPSARRCPRWRLEHAAPPPTRWAECGTREVVTFVPVAYQRGPVLVMGDACDSCAAVLRWDGAHDEATS